ncbi:DUF4268 domain-containing protein [Microbulbifer sp. MKSA007]|nr:DUF4268 domain-containing protein [Microbulbifer sp. MKSA007]
MYQIDRNTNRLEPLKLKKFSDLGFREREHLQEWLATNPEVLGEELLIIQKEFDGFNETRERLDLLVLDKHGHLVIIENKLDDSGRDVVWQALKYASYCASLTKSQIIDIYQRFLDKRGCEQNQSARERLVEFFADRDFDELILNPDAEQRIILVAAHFRRGVTSTAHWLMRHNLRLQCIKAVPYAKGDQLFLSLEQILPMREVEDYVIGLAEKKQEEQSNARELAQRHHTRREFWKQFIEIMRESDCRLFDNANAVTQNSLRGGSGLAKVTYQVVLNQDTIRAEFIIGRSERDENKYLFDSLFSKKNKIESRFGDTLVWDRLDSYIGSRVFIEISANGHNKEEWPTLNTWLCQKITSLEEAFSPEIGHCRELLKASDYRAKEPVTILNEVLE